MDEFDEFFVDMFCLSPKRFRYMVDKFSQLCELSLDALVGSCPMNVMFDEDGLHDGLMSAAHDLTNEVLLPYSVEELDQFD